ncbi:MAG: hypothetical protein PGN29_04610 [Gordonia paraffinivorans]
MTPDGTRSDEIARDQAEALIDHLGMVAAQLEREVATLEEAAREPDCRTAPRLLADARARRVELSEARSHIDTLRTMAGAVDEGPNYPTT